MKKSTIILIVSLIAIVGIASFSYKSLNKKEEAAPVARSFGADNVESEDANKENEQDDANQEVAPERPKIAAPDFIVFNEEAEHVSFSDFAGKPAVINFWASWCNFCKVEMPDFQKVYDKYKDEGVEFMMVAGTDGQRETRESAKKLFDDNDYTMPIYYDEALMNRDNLDLMDSANAAYRISGYPSTVFVDSDGFVVGIYTGALDEARLTKLVEFILDENNNGKSLEDALR